MSKYLFLPKKFEAIVREFDGSTSLGEWSDLASRASHKKGSIGTKGCQLFRCDNFAVEDVIFSDFSGNVEFRFSHSEPIVYLEATEFLLKILQSQSSGNGCWFFGEKLSKYQVYVKDYLERARRLELVRKYRISNRKNWLQVHTDNPKSERPIRLIEPHAQLLSLTQVAYQVPSKCKAHWLRVVELAKTQVKKSHKIYGCA